ncbi:MAG: SusC/RagA family TonB-linked outer membrane protein [Gemmatimonadales bacterium]
MVPALRRFFATAAAMTLVPAWVAAQQPAVISGQVNGDNGRPLAGATVGIAQLGLGATTRDDGRYTILVPANRVSGQQVQLTARAINYKPAVVSVTLSEGQTTQDFSLVANPLQLGEVVVTGAGTESSVEKLGNVRNNVSGQEIERSQEASVINALSAKAPNVTITSSSGEPGTSSFIQIRGPRTYSTSGQPLIIVDGLPIDYTTFSTQNFDQLEGAGEITGTGTQTRISDINPADIESVEILKGPAASSIYGARAASGAILITTKAGKAGPTRYTLRSNLQFDRPTAYYPLQRRYGQGLAGAGFAGGNENCRPGLSGRCLRSWGADLQATGTPTFDHAREIFETGWGTDQALTISGGSDRTLFFLSGNYNYTNGMIFSDNDQLKRVTVRLNGSHRATDRLKVGGNLAYANTSGRFVQRGNNSSAILLGGLRTPPEFNNFPYRGANGQHRSYVYPNPDATATLEGRQFDNPIFVIEEFNNRSTTDRVFGNVTGEWNPADWLKFNYTLGADYYNDDRLEGFPLSNSSISDGGVISGNITNFQVDHNLTATASWKGGENLAGSFTIGQNLNHRKQTINGTTGRTLISPLLFNLQNTVFRDPMIDQEFKNRVEGYFAQATIDIGQQLFLTGAVRYDGSNTYSDASKRAIFPKASAAWNFIRSRPEGLVSYGKLRASYGEAGIEPQPYQLATVTRSDILYLSGGVQGVGLQPTQAGFGGASLDFLRGNPDLAEERSKEFEAGFDIGLLKDKADVSFTWYNQRTSDVILLFPLAPSTGFQNETRNAGEFRNRGIEVSLNIRPVTTQNFGWDLGFQFARNRNRVLSLGEGTPDDLFLELPGPFLESQGIQKDQPFGIWRGQGLIKCGITPPGIPEVDAACAGAPVGALYIDDGTSSNTGIVGVPILDPNLRIVGDPNYDWTGSARTTFRIGGFQLSGLVDVRNGGKVTNGTRGALYSYGTHKDTEERATCPTLTTCTGNEKVFGVDFWFIGPTVGPGAGTPVGIGETWYRIEAAGIFGGNLEDNTEDGGFIRLREIALQYSLTQPWVRRTLGFSSVDLRVAGRNLLTSTDYTGLDPETNLGQAEAVRRGNDYFNMPQSRSFVLGVTLNR